MRLVDLLNEGVKRSEAKLIEKGRHEVCVFTLYYMADVSLFYSQIKIYKYITLDPVFTQTHLTIIRFILNTMEAHPHCSLFLNLSLFLVENLR